MKKVMKALLVFTSLLAGHAAFAMSIAANHYSAFITAAASFAALVCIFFAGIKFKAFRSNPGQSSRYTPFILMILALFLYCLPGIFQVRGTSMFGGEGLASAPTSGYMTAEYYKAEQSSDNSPGRRSMVVTEMSSNSVAAMAAVPGSAPVPDLLSVKNNPLQNLDIIRTFGLNLTAQDPSTVFTQIRSITSQNEGFVVSSDIKKTTNNNYIGTMDISVPSEKVNQVIAGIHNLDVVFERENMTTQEVTAEHADLQARVDTAKAVQAQYISLLQQAKRVDDILQLTYTIADYQREIDMLTASLTSLAKDIDFVRIHISVSLPCAGKTSAGGWRLYETLLTAIGQLTETLQNAGSMIIWLLFYWLPLLFVGGLICLLARVIFRKISSMCDACSKTRCG